MHQGTVDLFAVFDIIIILERIMIHLIEGNKGFVVNFYLCLSLVLESLEKVNRKNFIVSGTS